MKRPALGFRLQVVMALFLVLYGVFIVLYANFSPTDDVVFLKTLMQGQTLIAWGPDSVRLGRFAPFGAQEYNLSVLLPLPASPYTLFSINLLQFAVTSALLIAVLRSITDRWVIITIVILGFCLLPGSTMSWFRLSVGERDIVFYLAIFVFAYLRFAETTLIGYLLGAFLAANAAIYCKEPMFLAIGALALSHLAGSWKTSDSRQRALDVSLMGSAMLFIILYYYLVYLHRGPHLYSDAQHDVVISSIKNLANYTLFSDAVIFLILWPLAAWRAYRVVASRGSAYDIHDSLLLAAVVYSGAYVALNIYQPYYLLPAYVFGIPALARFIIGGEMRARIWKGAAALTLAVTIINTLPAGVHYLVRSKYLAANYNEMVEFLVQDIRSRSQPDGARIFLDGVDTRGGLAHYYILSEFLMYKGLRGSDFDLLSSVGPGCGNCPRSITWTVTDRYTVYEDGPLPQPRRGDYLVVLADANMRVDENYLSSFEPDYQPVFHTTSRLNVPLITAKTALKYILLTKFIRHVDEQVIVGRNLLNNPDYYVFVRK